MKPAQKTELLATLKKRFEKHPTRHKGIAWSAVETRLTKNAAKLEVLFEMERTGGEPDVIGASPLPASPAETPAAPTPAPAVEPAPAPLEEKAVSPADRTEEVAADEEAPAKPVEKKADKKAEKDKEKEAKKKEKEREKEEEKPSPKKEKTKPAPEPAKPAPAPVRAGIDVDNCDSTNGWGPAQAQGASLHLATEAGRKGKALSLAFDMTAGKWVEPPAATAAAASAPTASTPR